MTNERGRVGNDSHKEVLLHRGLICILCAFMTIYCRVSYLILDRVGFTLLGFNCLPNSVWTDSNLAEGAGHLSKSVEHPTQTHLYPGAQADGTSCIYGGI